MVGIQKNVIISQNCHLDGINSIQIKVMDHIVVDPPKNHQKEQRCVLFFPF